MTESDKRKIEELWLQGYGSTKIADKLGINVNTVKSLLLFTAVQILI